MAQQLRFDLPARTALGREDFFVSPANATAVAMVEGWANWVSRKLLLCGPAGSGKTHLTHVWAALSGATIIDASALKSSDIPAIASTHVAVENADEIAGDQDSEEALFHLHNLCLAEGNSLLFTAHMPPRDWGMRLPDLISRLQGTTLVALEPPDDNLLAALLMKLFADRQLSPSPETIPYLIARMPRSFAAARDLVAALDDKALEHQRSINRSLAREVLDNFGS